MFIQFLVAISDMQDQGYHTFLDEANCNQTLFVWILTSNIIYLLGIEYILKDVSVLFSFWGVLLAVRDALACTGGRGAPRIFSRGRALPLGATLTGRARAPSKSQFSTPTRDHQRSKFPMFWEKYLDLSMPKLFEAETHQRKFGWGPRRYETRRMVLKFQ